MIQVKKSITLMKPRAEVYQFWRQLERLPSFMIHLSAVTETSATRSHWVAHGPGGTTIEWDAEIVAERENEELSWRSLADSEVQNAGSVRFADAPADRGTEVRVALQYDAPGGAAGAAIAKWFGEEPSQHSPIPRSSISATPSFASPRRPSAARTCTSTTGSCRR